VCLRWGGGGGGGLGGVKSKKKRDCSEAKIIEESFDLSFTCIVAEWEFQEIKIFPPFPWIDVSRKQGFWCAKYLDFPCKIVVFKVMISQF
jgi:hypothetical protein